MNQEHLKFICRQLQLGSSEAVTSVYGSRGGSFIWRVDTEKYSYAIKQLAPDIDLKNNKIVAKYELSETIAYRFAQQGISAVFAIEHLGKRLIFIENTGYLVYPWIEGCTLGRNEISETHAIKIAELIAKLHGINMSVPEASSLRFDIHTNDSIIKAIEKAGSLKLPFAIMLKEKQNLILNVNDIYQTAIPLLRKQTVISHGDIDQLNVLWDETGQPVLIDWESARRLNPTLEIVRASLSWSGNSVEGVSLPIYTHMLQTYIRSGGILDANLMVAALNAVYGGMMNWMLYNIAIACSSNIPEEKDTASKEVNSSVQSMEKLKLLIPDLVQVSVN